MPHDHEVSGLQPPCWHSCLFPSFSDTLVTFITEVIFSFKFKYKWDIVSRRNWQLSLVQDIRDKKKKKNHYFSRARDKLPCTTTMRTPPPPDAHAFCTMFENASKNALHNMHSLSSSVDLGPFSPFSCSVLQAGCFWNSLHRNVSLSRSSLVLMIHFPLPLFSAKLPTLFKIIINSSPLFSFQCFLVFSLYPPS